MDGVIDEAALFERCVIYYLIERAYWTRYGDSEIVADLLQKLLEVDGHLGKIFDYKQFERIPFQMHKTTWTDGLLSSEEIKPFHYFMEHANRERIMFDGKRLAEHYFGQSIVRHHREAKVLLMLPLFSKTYTVPGLLVCLLQYGLFANSEINEYDVGKLLTGIIAIVVHSSSHSRKPSGSTLHIIEAGKVLLRAVLRVNIETLLIEQRISQQKKSIVWNLVEAVSVHPYLPYLKVRCTGPQELQHMCRRIIRLALYNNWNLPQGVSLLPLPQQLKKYINLQCD